MSWSVPRIWDGQTVAVLAGGPGLTQAVADSLRDVPCIAVNNSFRRAPWAAMLYAADPEWWLHEKNGDARAFSGVRVSCQPVAGVNILRNTGMHGFDPDPSAVRTGGNSGYQALHVAVHAGASRVLLAGFDMEDKGESHWHGDHPHGLRKTAPEQFFRWRDRFAVLAPMLKARGVDVVTVTPSAVSCFRRSTVEAELAACAESTP